jgi:hypothetical protein
MPHDPFNSRWMPLPIQARLDLLRAKRYAALIVWETLLCDALRNGTWQTSLPASAVQRETRLSHPTIRKAQKDLLDAGYIRIIAGGGTTRKKITFGLTPIENFGGRPAAPPDAKDAKPTGDWKL